jgi:hypothetical protein
MRTKEEVQEHYRDALQGKTPSEILADRINFFGSYQYMAKYLDPDVIAKVEFPEVKEKLETAGVSSSLDDHPGGLDEFASRKDEQKEEVQTFDSLKSKLTRMAREA